MYYHQSYLKNHNITCSSLRILCNVVEVRGEGVWAAGGCRLPFWDLPNAL